MARQHTHHAEDRRTLDGRWDDGRQAPPARGHRHGGRDHGGRDHGPADRPYADGRFSERCFSERRFAGRQFAGRRFAGGDTGRPSDDGGGLRAGIRNLMGAARQVGQAGDEGQHRAVLALLDETTRSVYRILADGPDRAPIAEAVPDVDGDATMTSPVDSAEASAVDAGTAS